jgi:hypothetical protein
MADRPYVKDEVAPLLVGACPSFEKSEEWADFWSDYGDEPDLLSYLLVSAFVRHLINLKVAGNTSEFESVFTLVEDLHVHGDAYVRELATVGILEDLQNTNLHRDGTSPEDFVAYLRPISRWWWEELYLFWAGKGLLGTSGRPRPPGMPDPQSNVE